MKKLSLVILFLIICGLVFAYSYPVSFVELLAQLCVEKMDVTIVTTNHTYSGTIQLVQNDYILLREKDGAIVITIQSIVEVSQN